MAKTLNEIDSIGLGVIFGEQKKKAARKKRKSAVSAAKRRKGRTKEVTENLA